jgi:hypothetical protein
MYGILKDSVVTDNGNDSNLQSIFSAPLSISSNQPTYVTDTVNLRRRAHRTAAQRWEIETSISRCDASMEYLVHSVIMNVTDIFKIRMPQPPEIIFDYTKSYAVASGAITDHIPVTNLIPVGSFITFGTFLKVYLVRESTNSSIHIFPYPLDTLTVGTVINIGSKVTMRARYDSGTRIGINYGDGILSDVSGVKLVEAL